METTNTNPKDLASAAGTIIPDLFEKAARLKLRFDTPRGSLPVEELFDLPLTSDNPVKANLDDLARALYKEKEATVQVSFVNDTTPTDELPELKLNVVKRVIEIRKQEIEDKAKELKLQELTRQIKASMAKRSGAALDDLSMEDLTALLKDPSQLLARLSTAPDIPNK